jgi:hypothetical protein
MQNSPHFEWTFSTRVRERSCIACRKLTTAYLTNLTTGVRKPLCASCFMTAVETSKSAAIQSLQPIQNPKGVSAPMKQQSIFRQGDVLIRRIAKLPPQPAQARMTGILAYGEVTGHAHRVETAKYAEVLEIENGLFLRVGEEGVRIVHEEHAAITLPQGIYEVEIQREYSPEAIRNVAD